jgi:hypothetical protein
MGRMHVHPYLHMLSACVDMLLATVAVTGMQAGALYVA